MTQSQASTVIAVAAEDGRYDHVWRRGLELARDRGARLVLFDVDAAPSPLESPLPTDWSADGEQQQFGDALTISDLEAAGRGPLADRVREAQRHGVDAYAWLPSSDDADELRAYAAHERAAVVVVPEGSDYAKDLGMPAEVVPEPAAEA